MTPAPVARLMAGMFENLTGELHLLDAGAGVGSLTAAFIEEACSRKARPASITATAYEPDPILARHLERTKAACREACQHRGIRFAAQIISGAFIGRAVSLGGESLSAERTGPRFTGPSPNPPYRKIYSESKARKLL